MRAHSARFAAIVATVALGQALPTVSSAQSCISSGTDTAIQAALNGAGAVVQLCPGAVFNLSNPVRFTAPNQVLQTQGLPTDNTRAILRIAAAGLTNAIHGNGQSGVTVQNVEVDGNIGTLGRLAGDALMFMGDQGSNQIIQNNFIHDTRSWSMLHMREGTVANNVPSCQNGRIVNNLIMSSGTNVPSGTWADGISLACGTTLVQGNTIIDATDGAIVIFGAPGSTIQSNTIISQSRVMLGGINLVDFAPVGGNYAGTRVLNNVIDARGALIKIGVASGPGTWFCEPDTVVNQGATIQGNTLQGTHMGYGFAVRGVSQWTINGNTDNSTHAGVAGSMCGGGAQNPQAPAGFQFYAPATQATLQAQFQAVTGNFWGLLNITENVGAAPLVYAQRTALSYAPVAVGQASTPQSVTITNTGPATASITGVTINGDYTQTNNCSSLLTGSSCVVYVTFRPSATGTRTGTLTVNSNAGNGAATVSLTGAGDNGTPVGTIATNPTSLTFPATAVGGASPVQTVTVSNTGTATATISSITPAGDFTQTNNCAALAAGASCTVSVTFRPSASGARTGSLTITSSASNSPNILSLSGTGGAATSSNIALGKPATASSFTQNFVAANVTDGNANTYWESLNNAFPQWVQVDLLSSFVLDRVVLKLPPATAWATRTQTLSVQISDTGSSFAIVVSRDCIFNPASGNVCTIPLPPGTSARYVRVNITANTGWPAGQVSEFEIWNAITGTATLSASPTSLAFGNQVINTTSAIRPVTITNTGTASATVSGVTIGGEFQQTNNCGTLAANATCTVNVTFRPTTVGSKTGTMTVNSNASNPALGVILSGTGASGTATLTANPTSLAFGNQAINTSSTAQAVTITNTGGASATVSGVTVGAEFLQTHNCATLAAGASCTVSVTFRPTSTGAKSATLTVNSNASNPALGVALSGTGAAATATLSANPTSLAFGDQAVNTTSAARTVTLTNTGNASGTVSAVTVSAQFSLTNNCGVLAAGASCTLNVTFTPTTAGAKTGTLTVTSNASNSSLMVGLTGNGTQATLSASPSPVAFGNLTINTFATRAVTITNTGSASGNITGVAVSGTGQFTQTNNCGALAASASCTVTVRFAPTTATSQTGTLTVSSNATNPSLAVPLSGAGVPAGTATLSTNPTSLAFGNQDTNTTSAARVVTVTNTGTASANVTGVTSSDGQFAQTNNCAALAAGASCTVNVTFRPTTVGAKSATVTVASNASNPTLAIASTGTGTTPGNPITIPASDFQKVTLAAGPDQMGEPLALAVLPDRSVLHTARDGRLFLTTSTGVTTVAATIPVYTHDEEGLQGVAVDPAFATNRWVYLYYAPTLSTPVGDAPESATDFTAWRGENRLSRFTLGTNGVLNLGSEVILLRVATDRGQCCHTGGDLDWDAQGNLYLTTGDDSNPFQSDAYSPLDDRVNRNPVFDARRSAGNSNDLRGKVLRIKPNADGTYAIPTGNLFPVGTAGTRAEIYAMGLRNPYKMAVDKRTGIVYLGEYGPDAGVTDANRGPQGQVEFNRIASAGNYGWPYCTGANTTAETYNRFNFDTRVSGAKFNCAAPANESRYNTGLATLPAARPAWIQYAGDTGTPPSFNEGGSSESPMGGPVYNFDPANPSTVKFPQYLDGYFFAGEFGRQWIKAIVVNGDGSAGAISGFPWTGTQIMDMAFGPDGALYVIDYGTGWGTNANTALVRIEGASGPKAPIAVATANPTSGLTPLTVNFSSAGSSDPEGAPLTYEWAFGDGTTSTAANPQKVYSSNGVRTATLTVRDPGGLSGSASVTITVGNTAPTVTVVSPKAGQLFSFGDAVPWQVTVTDPEQTIDCARVTMSYLLGHDAHAHLITSQTGCSGTLTIPADGEHDAAANIFGVFAASFTDNGANGQPALTTTTSVKLQPKVRQAEHFDTMSGIELVNSTPAVGGRKVGFVDNGDWIAFNTYSLSNATTVTVRAASAGAGGSVEFRAGSPTGTLLASVPVQITGGWDTFANATANVTNAPAGTTTLYVRFVGPTGAGALFDLDQFTFTTAGSPADYRVLVFSKTAGFRHDSIAAGIAAIQTLGAQNGFSVTATEDANTFTTANLGQYKAVVFLQTTGDFLNDTQQAAFQTYYRANGGFVGVHAAADAEYDWAWYGDLVGAYFLSHPPGTPTATIIRENTTHISTAHLPDRWTRADEYYNFQTNPRAKGVSVLLRMDETTYSGGTMGADHPITWTRNFDGGRTWYTGLGHTIESFSETNFLRQLLGGIQTAAGVTGPPPGATLSANPGSLTFGNQNINTTSAAQAVTITNTGSVSAAVSGVSSSDGQFAPTNNCATLNAGATCTVNVTFRPTTVGGKSATLTVSSNASNPSLGVGLSGTGVSSTTDLAAGKPATALSVQQGFVAGNVTDVNQATYWESQNNAFNPSQWVQVDLGSAMTVSRVVLRLPTNWGTRNQTLSVLGSTNNTNWSSLAGSGSRAFNPTANTVEITFAASSQRYIRIDITANTGWPAGQLSSLEVYAQ